MSKPRQIVDLLAKLELRLRSEKEAGPRNELLAEQGDLLQQLLGATGWDLDKLSTHLWLSPTHCRRLFRYAGLQGSVEALAERADNPPSPILEKHIKLLRSVLGDPGAPPQTLGIPPFWAVLLCQVQARRLEGNYVMRARLLRDSLERFDRELSVGGVEYVIHSEALAENYPGKVVKLCSFYRQKDFFIFVKRTRVEALLEQRRAEAEALFGDAKSRKLAEAEDLQTYLDTGEVWKIESEEQRKTLIREVLRGARPAGERGSDLWHIMEKVASKHGPMLLDTTRAGNYSGTDISFRRWRHSTEEDPFHLDVFCGTYRHFEYLRTNGYFSRKQEADSPDIDETKPRDTDEATPPGAKKAWWGDGTGIVKTRPSAQAMVLLWPQDIDAEAEVGLYCREAKVESSEGIKQELLEVWRSTYRGLLEKAMYQVATQGSDAQQRAAGRRHALELYGVLEQWLGTLEWLPDDAEAFADAFPRLVRQIRPIEKELAALRDEFCKRYPLPDDDRRLSFD